MKVVKLSHPNYEYDVHSLVKAFYAEDQVTVITPETKPEKLAELESSGAAKMAASADVQTYTPLPIQTEAAAKIKHTDVCAEESQLSMFSFAPNPVIEKLRALNLMEITPSKAFAILEELKASLES